MKTPSPQLLKQLKWYSGMIASGIVIANATEAQIIYTDIDPDIQLQNNLDAATLDLNNDGTIDFVFEVLKSYSLGGSSKFNLVALFPYSLNGVQGYSNSIFHYPSALSAGDPIDQNHNFWSQVNYLATFVWYYTNGGGTFGQWNDVTDRYLGIRLNIAGENHYGWVRCDVFKNPPKLVVKDFAYEATADVGIVAGDTGAGGGCSDVYEPNDVRAQAMAIISGEEIHANISSATDKDWFEITVDPSAPNLKVALSDLPANYDIMIVKNGQVVTKSNSKGTNDDVVILDNADAGLYKILVASRSGKFSATDCYTLLAETSDSPFRLDENSSSGNIGALQIFPNPAADFFSVETKGLSGNLTEVTVYDMLGKEVYRETVTQDEARNSIVVNCSGFASGFYTVRLNFESGFVISKLSVNH